MGENTGCCFLCVLCRLWLVWRYQQRPLVGRRGCSKLAPRDSEGLAGGAVDLGDVGTGGPVELKPTLRGLIRQGSPFVEFDQTSDGDYPVACHACCAESGRNQLETNLGIL